MLSRSSRHENTRLLAEDREDVKGSPHGVWSIYRQECVSRWKWWMPG